MATIEITRGADFYHVDGITCPNEAEAFEIARIVAEREGADFILGPVTETTIRNGKPAHFRICNEFIEGKWEGFTSFVEMDG